MWKFVGVNFDEREFRIEGVNVWAYPWSDESPKPVTVRHPEHGPKHRLWVHTVEGDGKKVRFAAGEASHGAWLFFVEEPDDSGSNPDR